ncbi:hypothetical protein B0H16DRAFT_1513740 [Mycena metata]|uniref:Uncharacterized protein n=1 Tax=Mycena metata TaxID=1033252 RepID=A0AAD7JT60_9AGAR|nr:hypothetical protein B0H16DRAFT_1513740 [Mycena metata]
MISHSYTFTGFAFYWDGTGEAVFSIGNELLRQPVGNSWTQAVNIPWSGQPATNSDVSGQLPAVVQRNNEATCFIIPDRI